MFSPETLQGIIISHSMHRLPHTSLPVSTPSTIYHSRLTVCLPDSLDLDRCLSILFWLSGCELAGSCDFAFVGALEIWSLRLRLRGQWHLQKRLCYLRQCHD